MTSWNWLTQYGYSRGFIFRVLIKTAILFAAVNLIFAVVKPLPMLGKISIYNWLVDGRERLPYGENQAESYNLSLNNLNAMFASHKVSNSAPDNYNIFLIGDSSTWGFLLEADDTLAGQLNRLDLETDGRQVQVYNLGYPTMSLTKDLMLLDHAIQYKPDLVIWLFTLESFPRLEQIHDIPLVSNNAEIVQKLISEYDLSLNADHPDFVEYEFLDETLVGRRRDIADWLRLQLHGVMWSSTRIDQVYPKYTLRASDFSEDMIWKNLTEPQPLDDLLVFDVLDAGVQRVTKAGVPIILVNEPMFISTGINSHLRYNAFYPRWAYDDYRELMSNLADDKGWRYLDMWDVIPPDEFTDSPVHMTPTGTALFAEQLEPIILE